MSRRNFEPVTILPKTPSFQANLIHFALRRLLTNLLSVELESIMEFYIEQAAAAIQEQISKLRESGYTADVSFSSGPLGSPPIVFIFV